jgi:hypothetical protein
MIYIYDPTTGKIAQKVDCPDDHAQHYERDGCALIVTDQHVDISQTYIVDGDFFQIHEKPSEFHVWDWRAHTWIQDRALAEKSVRAKRDRLLVASDWTQLPDVPLETKAAWAECRQDWRDITDQAGFPFSVIWRTAPQQ